MKWRRANRVTEAAAWFGFLPHKNRDPFVTRDISPAELSRYLIDPWFGNHGIGVPMIEFLPSIVGALAAGALAKAGDVGGRAVTDAYDASRALIVRKLGKGGAVQSIEDEPRSETAQAALAEALTKAGLGADTELAQQAEALRAAVAGAAGADAQDIEVGNIAAKVSVLVNNLVATGRIKLGDMRAETGDATLTNLTAGAGAPKKA